MSNIYRVFKIKKGGKTFEVLDYEFFNRNKDQLGDIVRTYITRPDGSVREEYVIKGKFLKCFCGNLFEWIEVSGGEIVSLYCHQCARDILRWVKNKKRSVEESLRDIREK
ncbi:MAG: hypothetical protein ACP5KG_12435 [Myxococcota bacterium]